MKLLSKVVLVFGSEGHQKVFEIDLCEAGPDRRLVNFRYGKRGTVLKEGTKTVSPVGLAEADRLLAELINTKIEQGYGYEGQQPVATSAASATAAIKQPLPSPPAAPQVQPGAHRVPSSDANGRQAQRVLQALRTPGNLMSSEIDRIIWRAGELRLKQAEDHLLRRLDGKAMRDYCVAWALGRCGGAQAIPALMQLYGKSPYEHVRRIACEALLKLSDDETRRQFRLSQIASLPEQLHTLARKGPASAFQEALTAHLASSERRGEGIFEVLYRIDNEHVRPAVLAFTRTAPLEVPTFRTLRHLFKMAEYRADGELFGLLAYRFEKTSASFKSNRWQKPSPLAAQGKKAYGDTTRDYLRRRVWRTLRRLGALSDADYVPMATGVLLPFSDADAGPALPVLSYGNLQRLREPYASYFAFNHVLFTHRPHIRFHQLTAVLEGPNLRGRKPEGAAREEAFPALWDAQPQGLLHLLDESHCEPVHRFASKALGANYVFFATLDADVAKMLLTRPYEVTSDLGLVLAQRLIAVGPPDLSLLLVVATSTSRKAREQGALWLREHQQLLLADSAAMASLATAVHAEPRAALHTLLTIAQLPLARAEVLAGRIIASVLALTQNGYHVIEDVARLLTGPLAAATRSLGFEVINDLLDHQAMAVHELAAQLTLLHDATPPDDVMVRLLSSTSALCRQVGVRLLEKMSESELAQRYMLLVRLSTHRHEDLRVQSRALVRRVATASRALGEEMGEALIASLLRRKLPEGAAAHVVRLLTEDLPSLVTEMSAETTWRLLQSGSPEAQTLGGEALVRSNLLRDLSVEQLARLASHELRSVREASWLGFDQNEARVKAYLLDAVRILDAQWQDSRAFGFQFFRERLSSQDFTASVLVAICDNVRPEVQAFGREMLSAHFRDEDGQELLMHLSEHPAPGLQLYTSSFLERFASNRPGRIEQLVPYFNSVLSRPNKGRVSKQRVVGFLRNEGLANPVSAELALDVLHRLSATCAIEYRALSIEAMVAIHKAFPALRFPLSIKAPAARQKAPPSAPLPSV